MKKTLFWMPLIAAMCVLLGCSNSTGGPANTDNSASYVSQDKDGNTYTLEITKNTARAYVPVPGDNYVLTVKDPAGTVKYTSSGTVESTTGGTLKLKHSNPEALPFTVTISDTGLMTKIGETIPVDPTEGNPDPASVTPPAIYPKTDGSWLGETVFMPNQQYHNLDGTPNTTAGGSVKFDSSDLLVDITEGVFEINLGTPEEEDLSVYDESVKFLTIDVGLEHGDVFAENVQYRSDTEYARLYYVTKDITVSGLGEDDGVRRDLTLKKGWNWVLSDKDRGYEKTGVPEGFKWMPGFPDM